MERATVGLSKAGKRIESMVDWYAYAPPKGGASQWEDGRSAKELARAWCQRFGKPTPPSELLDLFQGHPLFRAIQLVAGSPEARTRFDSYPGEPRNADLNLLAQIGTDPVAVSVEGKADESFGPSVLGALRAARKRQAAGKTTNAAARIRDLAKALFSQTSVDEGTYLQLAYQLLTGVAGTLALAAHHQAPTGLFVIHELVGGRRADGTRATKPSNVARNAAALDQFISVLAGSNSSIVPGQILGPYSVPGNFYIPNNVSLYIGKASRNLVQADA